MRSLLLHFSVFSLAKKVRLWETFLMTGFGLIAIPFASPIQVNRILAVGPALFFGTLFSLLSIYAANSYSGYVTDQLNRRFHGNLFESRDPYLFIAVATFSISAWLLFQIDPRLPILAAWNFLLFLFYSKPKGAKGRAVLGTVVHFFVQISQFHIAIIALSQVSVRSVLISIFFSLLLSSGHLMHELKDFEPDRLSRIKTNAVAYGPMRVIAFYQALLAGISLYWLLLFASGLLSWQLFLPFFLATVGHNILAWSWDKSQLCFGHKGERFQRLYRMIYLFAGLATFMGMKFTL